MLVPADAGPVQKLDAGLDNCRQRHVPGSQPDTEMARLVVIRTHPQCCGIAFAAQVSGRIATCRLILEG
jgi:hypothetical protein